MIVAGCAPGPDLRYYLGVRHQIPWNDASATTVELLRSFPTEQAHEPLVKPGKSFHDAVADFQAKHDSAWALLLNQPAADAGESYDVFMTSYGPSKTVVIKVIQHHTGQRSSDIRRAIEGVPPIRIGLAMGRDRAERMIHDLKSAGAAAEWVVSSSGEIEAAPTISAFDSLVRPAHALLEGLGLQIVAGETTAYPKAEPGPAHGYRYWATYLNKRRVVLFGVEKISGAIPFEMLDALDRLGFKARPNRNEAIIELPEDLETAASVARQRLPQLQRLLSN